MAKMTYFRRPTLVGNSLRRPATPSIRGNKRRKNADTVQAFPYFSDLPANGGTLQIETSNPSTGAAVPVEVMVLASTVGIVGFADVIAALNANSTFSGASLAAFDVDGCLGIRSTQVSSSANAYVRITGGTAATALGFNVNEMPFVSKAGDQPSAPEGRIGNPFDAVLPPPGESLTTETFTRALGRMMSNSDVLFSELSREEIVYKKIAAASGPASYLDLGDLAAGQKVFTDGGPSGGLAGNVLNASSTPATLTRFFFLVDRSSGRQSRSTITGAAHHDGAQALGAERQVLTGDVLSIPNGRVVKIGSTSGAQVGDYAKISNAVNRGWSNNGYRWVVEEVMADGQHLALRPMSAQELARVNETELEHHPYVELCTEKESGGSYGTLTLYKGPFADDITLTISPPLVSGQSVDIWAAVPASFRDRPVDALSAPSFTPYTPYITVGAAGDFQDLTKALAWVATSPGADAVEIILMESQVAPAGGYAIPQSLVIRAAVPAITLGGTSGYLFAAVSGPDFPTVQLVNLNLTFSPVAPSSNPPRLILTNVGLSGYPVAGVDSNYDVDIGAKATSVLLGKLGAATNVRGFVVASAGYIQAGGMTGVPGARLNFDATQGFLTLGKVGEQDVSLTKDQVDVLVGGSGSDAQTLHKHQDLVTALATETATRGQNDTTLQAHIDAEATARGQADLDIRNWADARYLHLTGGSVVGNTSLNSGIYYLGVSTGAGVYVNPGLYVNSSSGQGTGFVQLGQLISNGSMIIRAYNGTSDHGTLRIGALGADVGGSVTDYKDDVTIYGRSLSLVAGAAHIGLYSDVDLNPNTNGTINNVKDPVSALQAANKAYVDAKTATASQFKIRESSDGHAPGIILLLGGESGYQYALGAGWIELRAGHPTIVFTSELYFYTGWNSGTHEIYFDILFNPTSGADTVVYSTYRTCGIEWFTVNLNYGPTVTIPADGTYHWQIRTRSSWGSYELHGSYSRCAAYYNTD